MWLHDCMTGVNDTVHSFGVKPDLYSVNSTLFLIPFIKQIFLLRQLSHDKVELTKVGNAFC